MTGPSFDTDTIRMLAALLAETGLTEIEVAGKDGHIRVARHISPPAQPLIAAVPVMPAAEAPAAATPDAADHPGAVKSPMVGVAYLSPEPGAPPYVTQGQAVVAGQTLLLVEAMKTFNQIKAQRPGTVARILVQSGMPVEYGEPLMILE